MRVWRLTRARRVAKALQGEGARLYGGRWNPKGVAMVYASATLSLAVLEALVHVDVATLPEDYRAVPVEIPDDLPVGRIEPGDLPRGWRAARDQPALQKIGADWVQANETAVLSVPSAVIPEERNVLINPAHPEAARIAAGKAQPFCFDPRLTRPDPGP